MLEANRIILDGISHDVQGDVDAESEIAGRVTIGKGSKIINSCVRGPAVIGEGCVVENAFIGPYSSINDRCRIISSEVEHSIILEDSQVLNIGSRLEDSLIGKNVRIDKDHKKPKAYRMMVGDNSAVSLV